ncbi:hypothetical protein SIID45300_01510 [Candidatus Magnetaquicoccaceae bacterium FCR-1]|uniref:Uncharacterized protein n=1 Tax=Candidatus Magnetaquiglobus chichijimensis TaxID=3141448 RepID=A0ABQ0C8G8_9PROT
MKIFANTLKWAGLMGCAAILATPTTSIAADAAPAAPTSPHTVTANVGVVSNYLFRGLTQTWDKPAVQGGIDYSHASGLYAGTWISNVSDKFFADGWAEIDLYGGYNGKINDDWTWTVGTIGYLYPSANFKDATPSGTYPDSQSYNTLELNAGLGYKWVSAKVSVAVTDYFGANKKTFYSDNSKGTTYWDLTANVPLPESIFTKDVTMPLHVGYTNYTNKLAAANAAGATNPDYVDYKVGLTKAFDGGISVSAAYIYADNTRMYDKATSVKGGTELHDLGGSNFVVSLLKTF